MPKNPLSDPPAIVRPAEKDENWDLHVKAAIGFATRSGKAMSLAGAELLKAKMGCPPGLWLKTLAKHGVARRTAQRWIESFRRFSECATVAHLNQFADEFGQTPDEEQEIPDREAGDEPEDHPVLKIIVCKNCRRKGAVRDCKECAKARAAFVGKGGKSGRSKKGSKGGKVLFDWKKLEDSLGGFYRIPERVAKAYPVEATTPEHERAVKLLNELADLIKSWRQRIQGDKS